MVPRNIHWYFGCQQDCPELHRRFSVELGEDSEGVFWVRTTVSWGQTCPQLFRFVDRRQAMDRLACLTRELRAEMENV